MEEKILIKSKRYNIARPLIIIIVALSLMLICCALHATYSETVDDYSFYSEYCNPYSKFSSDHWYSCPVRDKEGPCIMTNCSTVGSYVSKYYLDNLTMFYEYDGFAIPFLIYLCFLIIALLVFLSLKSYEMIVTDKRIYGRTAWGKRVDLPIDSVSAVSLQRPKAISVSTSSGRIAFKIIKNRDEIYDYITNLLVERQSQTAAKSTVIKQEIPQSNADELKKYKELLDSGVITQEEFDAKKKQLLGL